MKAQQHKNLWIEISSNDYGMKIMVMIMTTRQEAQGWISVLRAVELEWKRAESMLENLEKVILKLMKGKLRVTRQRKLNLHERSLLQSPLLLLTLLLVNESVLVVKSMMHLESPWMMWKRQRSCCREKRRSRECSLVVVVVQPLKLKLSWKQKER